MKIKTLRIDYVINKLKKIKKENGNLYVLHYSNVGASASFSSLKKDEICISSVIEHGKLASGHQIFNLIYGDEPEDMLDDAIQVVTIGM